MTIGEMRTHLISLYPGDSWKRKVRIMNPYQVIAVYMSKNERIKSAYEEAQLSKQTYPGYSIFPSETSDIYWTCPLCDANLDFGEKCDCGEMPDAT